MSETTRKLASIQRIDALSPIAGADRIEVASILGWKCVVKKGDFKVGDLVVYFEIDSFLPIKPEYEFLRSNSYRLLSDGREGFRIKTIRLRKQISQGLVLSLAEVLKNISSVDMPVEEIGYDLTALLGVVKYEQPMSETLKNDAKGRFPEFLLKTDEPRVQLMQTDLNECQGRECYVTEKVDGSSVTYYIKDGVFGVCSRNLDLKESDSAFWRWARENDVENKLRLYAAEGRQYALQGEIHGPNINGNPLALTKVNVLFFNVFNIDTFSYVDYEEFKTTIENLGFQTVPIIDDHFTLTSDIEYYVNLSQGNSALNVAKKREGIVIRSKTYTPRRISFKAINPLYLLENDA